MIDNTLRMSEVISPCALSSGAHHKTPKDSVAPIGKSSPSQLLAAESMADLVPDSVRTVLELTQGQGRLVQVLYNRGYDVISMERIEGMNPFRRVEAVLMIPPFNHRVENEYLKKAMTASDIVISLMPRFTLMISAGRTAELVTWGLRSVTHFLGPKVMDSRVQSCILQLERGYRGKIELKFIGGNPMSESIGAKRYALRRSIT